jgi:hypothetical protein
MKYQQIKRSKKQEISSTLLQAACDLVSYTVKRSKRFFAGQVTNCCKVL